MAAVAERRDQVAGAREADREPTDCRAKSAGRIRPLRSLRSGRCKPRHQLTQSPPGVAQQTAASAAREAGGWQWASGNKEFTRVGAMTEKSSMTNPSSEPVPMEQIVFGWSLTPKNSRRSGDREDAFMGGDHIFGCSALAWAIEFTARSRLLVTCRLEICEIDRNPRRFAKTE
jgi:hypothetical protein